jgi:GT2 family glycosyltransferase
MPTYNGGAYLRAALESLRVQTANGFEVIAVDDGSTDDTLRLLDEYSRILRLRVVRQQRSGNWVAGTNVGLSLAAGEYACFLHQDDLWLPGRAECVRRIVDTAPEAALVVHPSWFVGENGERLGLWRCPLPAGKLESDLVLQRLIVQNFLAIPAPVFRREVALQAGGLDSTLWYTADWDLWLTVAQRGVVVHEPEALAAFRVHDASQTSQRSRDGEGFRAQLEAVLRKHLRRASARHDAIASAAAFSVEVNVALAQAMHGRRVAWGALLKRFFALGPAGWRRFLRDSRIIERVFARLRLRFRRRPT